MRLLLAGQCPYYHCIWQEKNSIVHGDSAYRKTIMCRLFSQDVRPNQLFLPPGTLSASKAKFWIWSFNQKYSDCYLMRLTLAGQCPYYHCIWQVKNSIVLGDSAYRKTNWADYSPKMLNQTNYFFGLVVCLHLRQSFEDEVPIKSTLIWPLPDETAPRGAMSLLPVPTGRQYEQATLPRC